MLNFELQLKLKNTIREVKDFPIEGISFKDITPIFQNPKLNSLVVEELIKDARALSPDVIVGIDSRGFIYGNSIALALGVPFVLVRKKGKLPHETIDLSYGLEYGEATLSIHKDSFPKGSKILIHDDLLATGGTAEATAELIEVLGGEVVGFQFLIDLTFLKGKDKLMKYSDNIISLTAY